MMPEVRSLPKRRLILFVAALAIILGWNMGLATRRKYYTGKIVPSVRKDVVLTVTSASRIEPRVQETVRSLLRGRKGRVLVREGDAVTEGQLLMEISDDEISRELKQKRIVFSNARSDVRKAKTDLALARTLFRKGAVSSREVDDAEQKLARENQELGTASDELALSEKKAAGVRVVSPLTGIVLSVIAANRVDIGEGDELVKVAQMKDLIVRAAVDEVDIGKVSVGQEATVTCEAFPDQALPGRVERIYPQAKEGVFPEVEVLIKLTDTKGLSLKPNLSCESRIIVGRMPDSIVVPAAAIHRGPTGTYVLKSNFAGWLKPRTVTVAEVSDGSAILSDGLNEGDAVLVRKEE